MNKIVLFLIFFLIVAPRGGISQLSLDVVYPSSDVILTPSDSIFVYGAVNPTGAQVSINGYPVRIHDNGGFLEHLPTPADYVLDCLAVQEGDSVRVRRPLQVATWFSSTKGSLIDTSFVFPKHDVVLKPGDVLEVAFKGAPGLDAFFSVEGLVDSRSMAEVSSKKEFTRIIQAFALNHLLSASWSRGIYYGFYRIPEDANIQQATVKFGVNGTNGKAAILSAKGAVSVLGKSHQVVELIDDVLAASGYTRSMPQIMLPAGSQLMMSGRKNAQYRVMLSDTEQAWIPDEKLRFLDDRMPLAAAEVSRIQITSPANKLRIKVSLDRKLPYTVEQTSEPSKLTVTLFNAYASNRTKIRYPSNDALIREIQQQQPSKNVYRLNIHLNKRQQWGYRLFYVEDGLVIDIRKPPKDFELKNMLICLDPGHAPDDGVLGPHRLKEKNANLQVALRLKEALEKKGAIVYLTRTRRHGVSTEARMKMAAFLDANLFLSIHHAMCPDSADGFVHSGSSTSYFYSQSRALARAIQIRLLDKLELPDEGFYHHPAAVNLVSQMPAVMIKPASIAHPEEEILLQLVEYQEKTAEAIVKGIEDFLKQAKKELD